MEHLRRLIDAGRNHYEKLILILALLGLGTTVWKLNNVRQKEADKIQTYLVGISRQPNKALPPVNMAPHQAALKVAAQPLSVDFSLPHNLFNPVKWQRQPNGDLIKIETGGEVGPAVMEFTKAQPLNYILSLERATGNGGYYLGITREAAENPLLRRKRPSYATKGQTNEFYALLDVKGDPKAPDELILLLPDTQETVSVAPDKPYVRTEGYEADLKYPPEGKEFRNVRVGAELHFAGEDYKIVAISADEVVLSASSNNKKYTVRLAEVVTLPS